MQELKPGQLRPNGSTVIYLDPQYVVTSPYQARETYTDLEQLSDSILSEGQQIPIRVWLTPTSIDNGATATDGSRTYIIYCHDGNRRLRAFLLAQEKDPNSAMLSKGIRAIVIPEISSETEALISQYTLNNTGRDFNALEEATICNKLIKAGFTHAEVADKLGKSAPWVTNTVKILTYSDKVKDLIRNGQLSASLAVQLIKKTDDKAELEQILVDASEEHDKITMSKLTGKDKRTKKDKIPTRKAAPDNVDKLTLSQTVKLFLESTHSIASVTSHELQIIVPKSLYHRLETIMDGDDTDDE